MRKPLLVFLATFISLHCFSQITFEKGYFINNNNDKIECLIENQDWKNNPTSFNYKISDGEVKKSETISSVKEFGLYNISKYVRSTVNIDRSEKDIDKMSSTKEPVFEEETLFLKVLVEGKASLYQYANTSLRRYFYSTENKPDIEQLVYKVYKNNEANKVVENNDFRGQLWDNLKCNTLDVNQVRKTKYQQKQLESIFVKYNTCNNAAYVLYKTKRNSKDVINITLRPRIMSSFFRVENNDANIRETTDLDAQTSFGFGAEIEYILPYNKNKWGIIAEVNYSSYQGEKSTLNTDDFFDRRLDYKVDNSLIEISLGLRHYLYLNNDAKFFINAGYALANQVGDPSLEYSRTFGTNPTVTDVLPIQSHSGSFLGGLGFKYKNKFSLEYRMQSSNAITLEDRGFRLDTNYNINYSLILGYTVW